MGFFEKGALFYLLLAISMAFFAPASVFNVDSPSDATFLSWFNIHITNISDSSTITLDNANCTGTGYSLCGSAQANLGNMSVAQPIPQGITILSGFIDPVAQVFSWIGTFLKVLFSPIIMFTKPAMAGAPIGLLMLIAIPATLLFIIGLIIWIRSGS